MKSLSLRYFSGQDLAVSRAGGCDVAVADDHQARNADLPQQLSVIHVPESGTATSVSDGIGPENYRPHGLRVGIVPSQRFRREKTLHHQVDYCGHPTVEDGFPAGIPICPRSKLWR